MPQSGEQAQPRRSTGDFRNGYGESRRFFSASGESSAPETDDAFNDPETGLMEPPRTPNSAVKIRSLPPKHATGPQEGPTIPRRSSQRTTTTSGNAPAVRGGRNGAGDRASWLFGEPEKKSDHHVHWLLPLGIGMISMLLLWVVGSSVLAWGLGKLDDLHYGYPRTYQVDAVVGHGDSNAHPSHFMAVNLHGQAIVIEFPAGDPQHAMSYVVPYYIRQVGGGQGGDLTPVTVTFRDVNSDGKPDMIVQMLFRTQVQYFVFINTGTKFRPPTSSDKIHL